MGVADAYNSTSFPLAPGTQASLWLPAGTWDPGFPRSPGFVRKPNCECKEKVLKEIKSATLVNTQMIIQQNSLIADLINYIGLYRRLTQPQHSLKPKPNPEQSSYSLQFYEY
ncbi:hypothetical protein QTO34_019748 [Cnephaeus nilssonii]|uniref:Uncharacterized protein n=1 Tax=Cnephaeus nilssonii TaxID=3371016 RepID=A0AA40LN20_CNENI|nr:hypothetical protein QTO34_019748 [Eptesicus nilssonii]